MKKTIIAAGLFGLFSLNAQADAIGVYLGGQAWMSQFDGKFGKSEQQESFTLSDKTQGNFYIALEHPLPFIPNVRISRTVFDTDGITTLANDFEFSDSSFDAGTDVDTTFNLRYLDYTLYYEVFDNDLVSFDIGLTVRDVDADINVVADVSGTPVSARQKATGYAPLLYVATVFGIPATDFSIYANGNFLSVNSDTMYDYQAGVSYQFIDNLAVDASINLGYRGMNIQLQDLDNLYTDITFKGVFAGLEVHF